ncbi:hypothetical protein JCM1841_005107 [Sporobolomyces salmonicolor]
MATAPVPFPSTEPPSSSSSDGTHAPAQPKPKRALYSSRTSQPFARSALKRQSVMALPSIAHLQHTYAKLGLGNAPIAGRNVGEMVGALGIEERREARRRSNAIRASLTGGEGALEEEEEGGPQDGEEMLGPEPEKPEVDTRMPWEKTGEAGRTVKDERELRREVLEGLENVCDKWGLITHLSASHPMRRHSRSSYSTPPTSHNPPSSSATSTAVPSRAASPTPMPQHLNIDRPFSPFSEAESTATTSSGSEIPLVLDLLTTTTSAIRSVQRFVVALPTSSSLHASTSHPRSPSPAEEHLRISTAARPRTSLALPVSVSSAPMGRSFSSSSSGEGKENGTERASEEGVRKRDKDELLLATLRKKSLEVLGMLRDLEGRYRLPSLSAEDEAAASPVDTSAPPLTLPLSQPDFTPVPSSSLAGHPTPIPRYSDTPTLSDVDPEAELVRDWVEVVDQVLSARERQRRRRRGRRSGGSEGEGEGEEEGEEEEEGQEEDGEEVPEWARKEGYADPLDRAYSILVGHLPLDLARTLPDLSATPKNREAFLDALSNGHLLCLSYNIVLRDSSTRPFGFIPASSIHSFPVSVLAPSPSPGPGLESAGTVRTASSQSSEGAGRQGEEEQGEKREREKGLERVGQTFRRMENLRVWAAALKFRYSLSLGPVPSSPTSSEEPAFDPRLIAARKDDSSWREMLRRAVGAWAEAVGREAREETEMEVEVVLG